MVNFSFSCCIGSSKQGLFKDLKLNSCMGRYYALPFAVLKITGNYEKLLTGIATNVPQAQRNAFIDIYGKIVAVFYQHRTSDGIIIAFPEQFRKRLEAHLGTYLKLGKAKLEETALKTFFIAGEEGNGADGIKIPEKAGFALLSENAPAAMEEMNEQEFDLFRLENGISVQGKEFDAEMIMNTDWKDAVSFNKGCFLGQEIVSKIQTRGRPPRKLIRVLFEKEPQSVVSNGITLLEVRSKSYSKKREKWIAYCSVQSEMNQVDGGEIIG